MKILLSLAVFWTLVSPGITIQCFQRVNDGDKLVTCLEVNRHCVSSSYIETITTNKEKKVDDLDCAAGIECVPGDYDFSSSDGKRFHMRFNCCNTNGCNKSPPALPPRKPNGLKCPACFLKNGKSCTSKGNITCTSGETQCIDMAGSISIGFMQGAHFAMQGCATPNICNAFKNSTKTLRYLLFKSSRICCSNALPAS